MEGVATQDRMTRGDEPNDDGGTGDTEDGASTSTDTGAGGGSGGPNLTPVDKHIIEMLSNEQWTTGAIIDAANERVRSGDLIVDGIDADDIGDDEKPVSRQMIYEGLNAFKRLGAVEYAHEPTSLYRMVYDPRQASQCVTQSGHDGESS